MAKPYGDIRDELDADLRQTTLICESCGATVTLDLTHLGLDWPDKHEGWCKIDDDAHICPACRPDLAW